MKEQILSALKAKFPGVNAVILGRIADMIAKTATTTEEVTTAVAGVTKEYIDVIEAYGDSRATDAQKTAVQNYESRYGLKDGEKVQKEEKVEVTKKTAEEDKGTPDWAKALIESNKQLTERLNRMEGERTTASRKAALDTIIEKLPESLRKGYSRISVETLTDEEFNALKGEIETEVEDITKETGAKGAVFGRPKSDGGKKTGASAKEATDEEATAVVDKLNV